MNYEPDQAVIGNATFDARDPREMSGLNGRRTAVEVGLLFEDLPAGIRAKIALDQIALAMDSTEVGLNIRKRSFESLKDREPCEWVVNEGMRADILWLAMQGQRDLSESMAQYVAAWMYAEGKKPARAVVLSFDPTLDYALRRDRVLNAMSRIEKAPDASVFVDFGNIPTAVWRTRFQRIASGAVPFE